MSYCLISIEMHAYKYNYEALIKQRCARNNICVQSDMIIK